VLLLDKKLSITSSLLEKLSKEKFLGIGITEKHLE